MRSGWLVMNNSIIKRATLSDENMALLSEIKAQNEDNVNIVADENKPDNSNQDELDYLWRNFRINKKDDRSPGIYILVGFIAGALSMFLMTAMLSISAFSNMDGNQVKNERKLIKKKHGSFSFVKNPATKSEEAFDEDVQKEVTNDNSDVINDNAALINENSEAVTQNYRVKRGDSLEAISVKYYGKASPENTLKIQSANNLKSPHSIYEGQTLIIPMN